MKYSRQTIWHRIIIIFSYLIIVTIVLWLFEQRYYSTSINLNNSLYYFGQISGILSIVFISFSFLISTRNKFVEEIFGGLDKMYRVHMYTGVLSFSFILSHPIFLAINSVDTPEFFRSFFIPYANNSEALNFGIIGFWIFIILLFFSSNKKLSYLVWKLIHKFIGLPLLLISVHVMLSGQSKEYFAMEVWIFFWLIIGIVSFFYKTFLYDHIGPLYRHKITDIKKTDELFEIYLEPISKKLIFEPGQFAFIKFCNEKVGSESHPYTMSSSPNDEILKFSIKKLGDWSSSLDHLQIGEEVKVYGPYGQFYNEYLRKSKRQVWIGGGIGVTPFLSKTKSESLKKTNEEIYLIYSDNVEKEAVFKSEIENYDNIADNLFTKVHLSDTEGFLTADYIKQFTGTLDDTVFLICGPTPMREALFNQLTKGGVNPDDIVFELFEFK